MSVRLARDAKGYRSCLALVTKFQPKAHGSPMGRLRNISIAGDPSVQDMLQKAREATATKIKLDLATELALEEERREIKGKLNFCQL